MIWFVVILLYFKLDTEKKKLFYHTSWHKWDIFTWITFVKRKCCVTHVCIRDFNFKMQTSNISIHYFLICPFLNLKSGIIVLFYLSQIWKRIGARSFSRIGHHLKFSSQKEEHFLRLYNIRHLSADFSVNNNPSSIQLSCSMGVFYVVLGSSSFYLKVSPALQILLWIAVHLVYHSCAAGESVKLFMSLCILIVLHSKRTCA